MLVRNKALLCTRNVVSTSPCMSEWSENQPKPHTACSEQHSFILNIWDVLNTCQKEKKKHLQQRTERHRKNACYLRRWNGCVGGCTCECRLLGAVSGKWVLSGKRRAALVRRSAPRPAERQSRFHGVSLFSALAQRQSSRLWGWWWMVDKSVFMFACRRLFMCVRMRVQWPVVPPIIFMQNHDASSFKTG